MPIDQLRDLRSGRLYTTSLLGDSDSDAAIKDLVVKAQDSIVIKPNNGLGANLYKKLKLLGSTTVDGSLNVDNVTLDGNTVSTSSGALAISSNSGSVRVADVVVTSSSLAPSSDVDLTIAGGATKSVVIENVKFTDNEATTTGGVLELSSGGSSLNAIKAGGVTVTDASVSSSTTNGNLTVASNGTGSVLVDNVKVKTNGISNNVTNADLTLTSNGTGSVVIDSVKVKTAGITTSSGTLALTSAGATANLVNVGGVTVTNNSLSTGSTTLTVAKDLTLTSTAGGSGKVTTSAGNLELTSTGGTVAVTGAATVSGTVTATGGVTSTGDVTANGKLYVAGVVDSTNASGKLEVADKAVNLGHQDASVTVADFQMDNKTGTQSATCTSSLPSGTFSVIAKVFPGADLSLSAADALALLSYGPTALTVLDTGKLRITDGVTPAETSSDVVGSTPFTVAIVRDGSLSSTRLYVDGSLAATIASSADVGSAASEWLGKWEFENSLSNTGAGTSSGAFTKAAGSTLSATALAVPITGAGNVNYVWAQEMNTTGVTADDGFGMFAVEVKASVATTGYANVFTLGQDHASKGAGERITLYAANSGSAFWLTTEPNFTRVPNANDNYLNIPYAYLTSLGLSPPTDGLSHKYKLLRKALDGSITNTADQTSLFRFCVVNESQMSY
eukprot:jgi/Mesvir1/18575/Mv17084-RA.1